MGKTFFVHVSESGQRGQQMEVSAVDGFEAAFVALDRACPLPGRVEIFYKGDGVYTAGDHGQFTMLVSGIGRDEYAHERGKSWMS